MAVSQARLIACQGAEKKSPHAFSTVVVVNAVSSPPMMLAVRMASAVTVTASPSITAKRIFFQNGRRGSGEAVGSAASGAADSAASLIALLLVRAFPLLLARSVPLLLRRPLLPRPLPRPARPMERRRRRPSPPSACRAPRPVPKAAGNP